MVRNCYVMPVEEMEERLTHQDEPHFLDGKERTQAKKHPFYLSNSAKVVHDFPPSGARLQRLCRLPLQ